VDKEKRFIQSISIKTGQPEGPDLVSKECQKNLMPVEEKAHSENVGNIRTK